MLLFSWFYSSLWVWFSIQMNYKGKQFQFLSHILFLNPLCVSFFFKGQAPSSWIIAHAVQVLYQSKVWKAESTINSVIYGKKMPNVVLKVKKGIAMIENSLQKKACVMKKMLISCYEATCFNWWTGCNLSWSKFIS